MDQRRVLFADYAEGQDRAVLSFHDPHQAEAGLALRWALAQDQGLAAVELFEQAAGLDKLSDPEDAPAQPKVVGGKLAILGEPRALSIAAVDGGGRGSTTKSTGSASTTTTHDRLLPRR